MRAACLPGWDEEGSITLGGVCTESWSTRLDCPRAVWTEVVFIWPGFVMLNFDLGVVLK